MDGKKITVKVEIPVGYDLVINGTDCKLVPKPILPKTWEEFCKMHPIKSDKECIIGSCAKIMKINDTFRTGNERHFMLDRFILPSMEVAESFIALCQLIHLRDCYNGDWKPDWSSEVEVKHTITFYYNRYCDRDGGVVEAVDDEACEIPRVLAFKSKELRDQFLENFRDLIEAAKPLI